jgi:hypothetical protein
VDYKKTICKSPGCLDCKPDNENCVKCDSSKGYFKVQIKKDASGTSTKSYCHHCTFSNTTKNYMDPKTGNCIGSMEFRSEKWFLVRRSASTTITHPAKDNALGTESYGTPSNNPKGEDNTFSIKYSHFKYTKILFAHGNMDWWTEFKRPAFDTYMKKSYANCSDCAKSTHHETLYWTSNIVTAHSQAYS